MAFSTLLTLFLLPIIVVWVFKGPQVKPQGRRELAFVKSIPALVNGAIRLSLCFSRREPRRACGCVVFVGGFKKDFMPQMEEGSILYMPTTLPAFRRAKPVGSLQQIDKKLKSFPE
jgi:Cu(I)/Ag(I) efflux system membrane protein CusA/SilA